jgi:4-amino-4-deoxy-L-arabinose transferase-like glycosyltransferase
VNAVVARRTAQAQDVSVALGLSVITLFALLVRIGWILWHGASEITWDGAEYARTAMNLASGHGLVGLRGMTNFVFPPLYSLAIAGLLPFAGDAERAAVSISVLSGAAFVVPIFGIAAICYGRRAGFIAAVLAAVLPFTVQLSTVALADMLFLTLAAGGTFFLLRASNEGRLGDAVACGAAFGLAYLTRPEGVLFEFLAVLALLAPLVTRAKNARAVAGLALAAILPFACLAAPYVGFLSAHAGHLRIEGKSVLNLDIGLRMRSGMSYVVAADAIDRNLAEVGPELHQDYYFEPAGRKQPSLGTILAFAAENVARHMREIGHVLASRLCGTVIFCLLAIAGFVAGPWSRRRVWNQTILVGYGIVCVLALASVYHFWDRYFIGFVPLLLVWAANGLDVSARAIESRWPASARWRAAVPALAAVFLVALLFSTKVRFADDSASLAERQAGGWLAQHGGSGARILAISDQAVFYAGGIWTMLPYAPDDETALRYVREKQPEFLILNSEYAAERPYVTAWLKSAIPGSRARVVYALTEPGGPTIQILRWNDAGTR